MSGAFTYEDEGPAAAGGGASYIPEVSAPKFRPTKKVKRKKQSFKDKLEVLQRCLSSLSLGEDKKADLATVKALSRELLRKNDKQFKLEEASSILLNNVASKWAVY